jgi:hypothetical protein
MGEVAAKRFNEELVYFAYIAIGSLNFGSPAYVQLVWR